jgi:hypothetical protein
MVLSVIILTASLMLVAPAAQAYIDPGTSGMLLQVIGAAIIGIGVAGRKYIGALVRKLFGGKKRNKRDGR